ncbi:MAG: hypothetical protein KGL34_05855 [Gammaproteobacteria bacterium]|nr:hypothetical protein [Gammaproteobacteria bacterium]
MLDISAQLAGSRRYMHQIASVATVRQRRASILMVCLAGVLLGALTRTVQADPQPDAGMMRPVLDLVRYMSMLPSDRSPDFFASRGVCIVENFAPFVFCGPAAVSRWDAGFREHSHAETLRDLRASFGPAHDLSSHGDRVYFSLPTTWTGLSDGRHFVERGAWAFVLRRTAAGWKILGYGWGVYSYRETR